MSWKASTPSAMGYFEQLVSHDQGLPLLESAVCLGHDVSPALNVQEVLLQVDDMASRLRKLVPWGANAMLRAQILNTFFYERMGFGPNVNDAQDPGNSYLHSVLQTRRGLPISLAVLWLELAWGIGLRAYGISFPGHFLVKVHVGEGILVQDPLNGCALGQEALYERLEPYREQWGMSYDEMAPLHMFLQPATAREVLERMLRNLKLVYENAAQWPALLAVVQRLLMVCPQDSSLYRDRGLVWAQLGQRAEALKDLQTYVRSERAATDVPMIEARIELLRTSVD